ncbi:hypothetical protein [Caulobacter sp. X]|uniref:hypothetical protein n=1 Tax=Caulobacter sp. X TaxID=2048901 RepID=UPI001178C5CB|nr:hypothetical protein [Caulobacter sp. X]
MAALLCSQEEWMAALGVPVLSIHIRHTARQRDSFAESPMARASLKSTFGTKINAYAPDPTVPKATIP